MPDLFSVYWTDRAGNVHEELKHVPAADRLGEAVVRLTQGPAAQLGIVTEVKVVDANDLCNFLWKDGKVVFPKERLAERGDAACD